MSQNAISRQPARPQLDAEQEVEVGRYWWSLLHRWWLIVAAVVVGAVIGYLVSLGGGTEFEAKATIYPGQPLTPSSNAQVASLQTNPSTINQIVKSDSVVATVAAAVGVPPNQLGNGISTSSGSGGTTKNPQAQLTVVSVRGPWRRQSALAANMLAGIAVTKISTYPDAKIAQLKALSTDLDAQIAALDRSIDQYRTALASPDLSTTDKILVTSQLNGVQQARAALVQQRSQNDLSLALAQDVERAQIVTRAVATKVEAKSRRSSIIVGAVIGLVVGILLALAWDPVRRRFGRAKPSQ